MGVLPAEISAGVLILTRSRYAAVALAAAALSCVGTPAGNGRTPGVATTLMAPGTEASDLSVGRPCNATGLETCFNATDDNCNGLVDEGCGLASGPLQIVIAWDEPEADVDLEVTAPEGEQVEVGQVTASGLTKDRDCPGDADECGGQNFEVVTIDADLLPPGRYRVTIRLDRPPPDGDVVNVRIGGHFGQDAIRGGFQLSSQNPRRSVEFFRSASGSNHGK